MQRKRNSKRRSRKVVKPVIRLPSISINWSYLGNGSMLAGFIACVYFASLWALDSQIDSVRIEGPFERVSAMQVEAAITPYMNDGFLTSDLHTLQRAISNLPWVARASVRRSWPAALSVSLTEERAAARWRKDGLLNIYGELFVEHASHIPAELPHLSGPDGAELQVARRFFDLNTKLEQRGLMATDLAVDERGSWELSLSNGMQVRFGAVAVDERTARFLNALDSALTVVADKVDYIDMRYTNGFAVGWKAGSDLRLAEHGEIDPHG